MTCRQTDTYMYDMQTDRHVQTHTSTRLSEPHNAICSIICAHKFSTLSLPPISSSAGMLAATDSSSPSPSPSSLTVDTPTIVTQRPSAAAASPRARTANAVVSECVFLYVHICEWCKDIVTYVCLVTLVRCYVRRLSELLCMHLCEYMFGGLGNIALTRVLICHHVRAWRLLFERAHAPLRV